MPTTEKMRYSTPLFSRRAVVHRLGCAIVMAGQSAEASPPFDGPPPFETSRQQFRIIHPVRHVPDIRLSRIDGTSTGFADFRGKVVLLNFWATWCPPCRAELPILDRLQKEMRGSDLKVVAVSVDRGDRRQVERFVQNLNIRHLSIYLDAEGRIAHSSADGNRDAPFALYGMPITYVIGRSGSIGGYLMGEADWSSEAAKNLLGYYFRRPPA